MAFSYGKPVGPKILGVDLQTSHTTAQHPVGSICYDTKGKKYRYIKAGGAVALGNLVKSVHADDPYTTVVVSTASNAATFPFAMTPIVLASGDYAWVLEQGVFEDDAEVVSAAVAPGDPFISDANGGCTIAVETDINNARGVVLVDDADNTGTVQLW